MSVVSLRGASKTYATGTVALSPVDLTIGAREFVTLLGPSGCGKTTLLNLVAGLVTPTVGELRWWGGTLEETGQRGRRMAYVFQSPTLMPWARIDRNVSLPLDLAGTRRPDAECAVDHVLRLVGLSAFARHFPRELSGGMQMRASIARGLVTDPDLLLMDEPFGALDEFTRQRLDSELLAIWERRRLTVVFVTHSISEAVFLSTRVVVMGTAPGRIVDVVAIDTPSPRDPAFRTSSAFLAYMARLSAAVHEAGEAALDGAA